MNRRTLTATLLSASIGSVAAGSLGIAPSEAHAAPPATASKSTPKPKALKSLLPKAPAGFKGPSKVQPRNRGDIYEQINGGSESYLANGMTDAIFATYAKKGGGAGAEISAEVFRFPDAASASKQFSHLYDKDGVAWEGGKAVIHEYGVEAVLGGLIIKVTFNEGDATVVEACKAIVKGVAQAAAK
jgi:hypothetical protein